MPATQQRATPYELHKGYVLAVLSRRCSWLDPGDREGFFHDAYEVMLEKQAGGELDPDAMHERELRAYLTQTALFKALAEGRRAERKMTTELDDEAAARPDAEQHPDERVATDMDNAPVREIVAELPARQQVIVKLRFYFERSPTEIQNLLGITERTYRRQLERAMRKVAERYDVVRAGRWCDSHRGLIVAYVAGLAKPERAQVARNHLKSCSGCAHMAAELREATRRAAAAVPLPLIALEDGGSLARIGEAATTLRDGAAELLHGAGRQLASLSGRADPSMAHYAPAARPGTLVATLGACVAIGGGAGTYCAVNGVPDSVRAVLGSEKESSSDRPEPKPRPAATPVPAPDPLPANPEPAQPPAQQSEPKQTQPEPAPSESAPAPAPAAPEFSPEAPLPQSSGSSGGAAPAPAPSPPQGPQNEFDF